MNLENGLKKVSDKELDGALMEVVIQSKLGNEEAAQIIQEIKRMASVEVFDVMEMALKRPLTEGEKESVSEYVLGSRNEESRSAGNATTLKELHR